jgi:D-alanyl-D-alanine carboxypeptidase/D-alanyl-D-alanine-endopeptidase (penicillin-binding protein 4)
VRGRGDAAGGIAAVDAFLTREVGVEPGSVILADGSGLSHFNLVTAHAVVQLLEHMAGHPHAREFLESLSVAGEDGSDRLDEPLTRGNVHAKTGTVRYASAYSGYLSSASGERMAFSILVNNRPGGKASAAALENAAVRALARFRR